MAAAAQLSFVYPLSDFTRLRPPSSRRHLRHSSLHDDSNFNSITSTTTATTRLHHFLFPLSLSFSLLLFHPADFFSLLFFSSLFSLAINPPPPPNLNLIMTLHVTAFAPPPIEPWFVAYLTLASAASGTLRRVLSSLFPPSFSLSLSFRPCKQGAGWS